MKEVYIFSFVTKNFCDQQKKIVFFKQDNIKILTRIKLFLQTKVFFNYINQIERSDNLLKNEKYFVYQISTKNLCLKLFFITEI
jgi:hypothetical protein